MAGFSRFNQTFRQEAEELLADIEMAALDLERDPADLEALNRIFRDMHTLKGSGAMFGYAEIAGFTHEVESALASARDGKIPVTVDLIDLILASRDHIKAMFEAADESRPADAEAGRRIAGALSGLSAGAGSAALAATRQEALSPSPPEAPAGPEILFHIYFRPWDAMMKNGLDPSRILADLRKLGPCVASARTDRLLPLEQMNPEACGLSWDILLVTARGRMEIEDAFIFAREGGQISIEVMEGEPPIDGDDLIPRLGDILMERGDAAPEDINRILGPIQRDIRQVFVSSGIVRADRLSEALKQQYRARGRRDTSIRIESKKLDLLIDLVGELVTTQAHMSRLMGLWEDAETLEESLPAGDMRGLMPEMMPGMMPEKMLGMMPEMMPGVMPGMMPGMMPEKMPEKMPGMMPGLMRAMIRPVEELERLTRDLRDCAMDMRMLPIGTIFGRFRRLVRDLAKELGKEIELVTEGGDTVLDKTVLERLADPLIHLIRNSIDHGIRGPEERRRMGKPAAGVIRLSARQKGPRVIITVADDGIGLDLATIRARAVERGLMAPDAALTPAGAEALIFTPGFSTSRIINPVSGRGVGMDVVKRRIESLGGAIAIATEPGRFMEARLNLPLTLAIIDGLLLRVGAARYILPLGYVERCMETFPAQWKSGHGGNMVAVDDTLVPCVRLSDLFDMPGDDGRIAHMVVVRSNGCRMGIAADEILGGIQSVIKDLGRHYRGVRWVAGASIMGDGSVALIIDVPGLMGCVRADGAEISTELGR